MKPDQSTTTHLNPSVKPSPQTQMLTEQEYRQARFWGYSIMAVVAIAAGTIGVMIASFLLTPAFLYPIYFQTIGALKIQDPVVFNGAVVGSVKSITLAGNAAIVTIRCVKPLEFYQNYEIFTADRGIMGECVVVVRPGTSKATALLPGDSLKGSYFPTVAEVLGDAWKLQQFLEKLRLQTRDLPASIGNRGLSRPFFNSLTARFDTITGSLSTTIDLLNGAINTPLDTLIQATKSVQALINKVTQSSGAELATIDKAIESSMVLLRKTESMLASAIELTISLQKRSLPYEDDLRKFESTLKELEHQLDNIRNGMIDLRLRISFIR